MAPTGRRILGFPDEPLLLAENDFSQLQSLHLSWDEAADYSLPDLELVFARTQGSGTARLDCKEVTELQMSERFLNTEVLRGLRIRDVRRRQTRARYEIFTIDPKGIEFDCALLELEDSLSAAPRSNIWDNLELPEAWQRKLVMVKTEARTEAIRKHGQPMSRNPYGIPEPSIIGYNEFFKPLACSYRRISAGRALSYECCIYLQHESEPELRRLIWCEDVNDFSISFDLWCWHIFATEGRAAGKEDRRAEMSYDIDDRFSGVEFSAGRITTVEGTIERPETYIWP